MQKSFLITLLALFLSQLAFAQTAPEEVRFAEGATSAEVRGTVEGYQTKEYKFAAKAGQILKLEARANDGDGRWMVLQVRRAQSEEADVFSNFISGDMGGDSEIKQTGDYIMRVGLRAPEAQRGGKLAYTISVTLPPVKGFMAEAKYLLDQTAGGSGQYEVDGSPTRALAQMKVQLEKSGAAHLEATDSDGNSFVLVGTYEKGSKPGLALTLTTGLGGRALSGDGTLTVREEGLLDEVRLQFVLAGQSKAHKLYFKSK